jgi:hypothetical protein
MSLFSSQTIFNLLITLIISVALYYYMKYKFRILELTQREHAKVLQSVIMSMDKGGSGRGFCMENQTGGESIGANMNNLQNLDQDMNRFREINKNELIDVSDEDDDESDDESSNTADSDTDSSESDSDSDVDVEEDHVDDSCNTKKIVITNSHDLHKVEHLTGPDIKVIELTHPLYPSNENVDNGDDNGEDNTEENDNDDCDDEDDSKSDSESYSESSAENEDEIKDNTEQQQQQQQQQQHSQEQTLEEYTNLPIDNSLDNISVTAVFKNKPSDTNVDYNAMTVSALRQTLKSKLVSDGEHMSETSINKLSKKDIIKLLH